MGDVIVDVETRALQRAAVAHGEQRNQHDGELYINHVIRVVEHLRKMGASPTVLAVAWLHDVVEDTDVTLEDIRAEFGDEIHDAVDAITHRKHEPRADYYARLGPNRTALIVKMSDGRDNTNPDRKARLDPATRERLEAKYRLQDYLLKPWIIHHLREE